MEPRKREPPLLVARCTVMLHYVTQLVFGTCGSLLGLVSLHIGPHWQTVCVLVALGSIGRFLWCFFGNLAVGVGNSLGASLGASFGNWVFSWTLSRLLGFSLGHGAGLVPAMPNSTLPLDLVEKATTWSFSQAWEWPALPEVLETCIRLSTHLRHVHHFRLVGAGGIVALATSAVWSLCSSGF